jgi:single-stranded-DNA-specific exonuclease
MKDWQIKFLPREEKKTERQEEIIEFLLSDRGVGHNQDFFTPKHPREITPRQAGIDPKQIIRVEKELARVKRKNQKILVWGDYDADGIIGTTVLWEAFWKSGFEALPFIPDRSEGYGLNIDSFKRLYRQNPDIGLVITVDNGIVAHRQVKEITSLGVPVVVTDHHAQEKKLPGARAIIWSDQVCGAVVAWFLARKIINQKDYALDLLALATVADMMPLLGVNRSLVKYGLESLANSRRVGLNALIKQAGIDKSDIGVYHLGFLLGPRLNAMGRIYQALDSVRLLCTPNQSRAQALAQKLETANRERQLMTNQALETLQKIVIKEELAKEKLIFIYHSSLHSGIIGLVAGKLADQFYRPSVVLSSEDGFLRASCRSIKAFNIIKALRKIDCLIDVGGHPLAAGFTVEKKNLSQVKKKLLALADKEIDLQDLIPKLSVDAQVRFSDLDRSFVDRLDRLAPFGLGNPEPLLYISGVIIRNLRRLGSNGNHLRLILDDPKTLEIEKTPARISLDNQPLPAIGFGLGKEKLVIGDKIDIVFNLMINRYRGRQNLELKIRAIRKWVPES